MSVRTGIEGEVFIRSGPVALCTDEICRVLWFIGLERKGSLDPFSDGWLVGSCHWLGWSAAGRSGRTILPGRGSDSWCSDFCCPLARHAVSACSMPLDRLFAE